MAACLRHEGGGLLAIISSRLVPPTASKWVPLVRPGSVKMIPMARLNFRSKVP